MKMKVKSYLQLDFQKQILILV